MANEDKRKGERQREEEEEGRGRGRGIMRMHTMKVKQVGEEERKKSRRGGRGQLEEEQMEGEFFYLSVQSVHLWFFI